MAPKNCPNRRFPATSGTPGWRVAQGDSERTGGVCPARPAAGVGLPGSRLQRLRWESASRGCPLLAFRLQRAIRRNRAWRGPICWIRACRGRICREPACRGSPHPLQVQSQQGHPPQARSQQMDPQPSGMSRSSLVALALSGGWRSDTHETSRGEWLRYAGVRSSKPNERAGHPECFGWPACREATLSDSQITVTRQTRAHHR